MLNFTSVRLSALIALTLLVSALYVTEAASQPIGADFTYQGQLRISGVPLNGTADFEIKLFDAPSGGLQQGGTNPINNINVVDGLFTAPLNFGPGAFNGDQRWLEISARTPAGSGNFTTLNPRQPLTAAPYALYALTGPGSGGPWTVSGNNVFNTNTGNVGIRTSTPSVPLHVASDLDAVMVLQDTGPDSTQSGYVGFWNSSGAETAWMGFGTPGSTQFSMLNGRPGGDVAIYSGAGGRVRLISGGSERMTVTSGGSVGIGTAAPAARLEVRGSIKLGNSGEYFAPASEENLRIIRGVVNTHPFDGCAATPTILYGSGFSVVREDCGLYRITFDTPFGGPPSVTATGIYSVGGCGPIVTANQFSSGGVSIQVSCSSSSVGTAVWPFSFIAIGPR